MLVDPLLDLVYPRHCLACDADLVGSPWTWLCSSCLALVEPLGPSPCPVCAGELGPGAASECVDCRRLGPRFDGAVAVGRYEGLLRELVLRLKYGRDASLAYPLGELLGQTLAAWDRIGEVERLVPMPLAWTRRLRRGFNQAELLAAEVGRQLRLPVSRLILRRRRGPAQAALSRSARLGAPRGSMSARDLARDLVPVLTRLPPAARSRALRLLASRVRGRTVLLVDDVLTTGASASEAARALKEAGARAVLVAVVARA